MLYTWNEQDIASQWYLDCFFKSLEQKLLIAWSVIRKGFLTAKLLNLHSTTGFGKWSRVASTCNLCEEKEAADYCQPCVTSADRTLRSCNTVKPDSWASSDGPGDAHWRYPALQGSPRRPTTGTQRQTRMLRSAPEELIPTHLLS